MGVVSSSFVEDTALVAELGGQVAKVARGVWKICEKAESECEL